MAITHRDGVAAWQSAHAELKDSIRRLSEMADRMPDVDQNGEVAHVNYGHLGDVLLINQLLSEAADSADELFR